MRLSRDTSKTTEICTLLYFLFSVFYGSKLITEHNALIILFTLSL